MNFDRCVSFKYIDYTGSDDLHWNVEYEGGENIIIITKSSEGVVDIEYLKYLVSKGVRFIDNKEEPIKKIFQHFNLTDYLYSPWVIQHNVQKNRNKYINCI